MTTPVLPDAEVLYQSLREQIQQYVKAHPQKIALVGIASGGQWLVERLKKELSWPDEVGVLSSCMHRDDFAQRGLSGAPALTTLPFEVNQAHLILIDDVLLTGRTIRAALNELFDYGRPARVHLMVLVDRQARDLPIQADWAACVLPFDRQLKLELQKNEQGQLFFEYLKETSA